MTPTAFIAAVGPAAQRSALLTGVPASVSIAQAALESAWGESRLAREAHNLFGIKAGRGWRGATVEMPTTEYVDGKPVRVMAPWRKYPDWMASINDHADFLRINPRYKLAFVGKRTGDDFARQIAAAGYATDPAYADKLVGLIRQHRLDRFDL